MEYVTRDQLRAAMENLTPAEEEELARIAAGSRVVRFATASQQVELVAAAREVWAEAHESGRGTVGPGREHYERLWAALEPFHDVEV